MVGTNIFKWRLRASWKKLTTLHYSKAWCGQAWRRSLNLSQVWAKFSLGLQTKFIICLWRVLVILAGKYFFQKSCLHFPLGSYGPRWKSAQPYLSLILEWKWKELQPYDIFIHCVIHTSATHFLKLFHMGVWVLRIHTMKSWQQLDGVRLEIEPMMVDG